MAADHLLGALTKLDRARRLLRELDNCIRVFLASDPFPFAPRYNEQAGLHELYVLRVKPVPPDASAIVGDLLHNLRSALDHLAFQLVVKGTEGVGVPDGRKHPFRHVQFPIFDSADEYAMRKLKCTKGMKGEAVAAIDEVMPYKEGNERLWQLHRLNNIDKHRLLLLVAARLQGAVLDTGWVVPHVPIGGARLVPLEEGSVLVSATPEVVRQMRGLGAAVELAIFEDHVAEGVALRPMLAEMLELSDKLVKNLGQHAL